MSAGSTRKRKQRSEEEASLTVGAVKIRRGTQDVDGAVRRRQERETHTLPQKEFTKRKRFVDREGNSYALPQPEDKIYRLVNRTMRLESLSGEGLPLKREPVKIGKSSGYLRGRALMYIQKRRTRKLTGAPRGSVQLLDTETMRLYTARIDRAFFFRGSKSGHVVLSDLTEFGTVSDPSSFRV